MRRFLTITAKLALALVLGLALCEAGLRVAAWATQRAVLRDGGAAGDSPIVCCGDSNVFGMYEREEDSYPGRLGALLRREGGAPVANLGIPGYSTRHALASAREALQETGAARPRALLFTAGVNNLWSWREDVGEEASARPWYEGLRIARLVRLLVARTDDPGEREPWRPDFVAERESVLAESDVRASIRADLAELAGLARAADVPLVVVGYAAWERAYAVAGDALRRAAEELDLPYVDPSGDARQLVERLGHEAVFHTDLHPRAVGYEMVARTVHDALLGLGLVEGAAVGDALAGLESSLGTEPTLRLVGSRDDLALEIEGGVPDAEFRVLLWGWRPAGEALADRSFHDLWAADPLFQASVAHDALLARFDAAGVARVSLAPLSDPERPLPELAGTTVRVSFVVRRRGEVGYLSPPVDVAVPGGA